MADGIPSTDYVHEKIDDYVEVLGSAVDEFNDPGLRPPQPGPKYVQWD